jgi:micrococcal nuclease
VVPEQQVSSVVQLQSAIQNATSTVDVSTTTKSFFVVSRVIDGDTIEVTRDGVKEKVRLIGINTPETVDPRKTVECFGKEASAHAKEILLGQKVTLVSDSTQTKYDKYGRLLAYVYRKDGLFVNKHMIQEGYAYEYTYRVPYTFQKEFKEAQLKAEMEGKGLWAFGVCE